MIPDEDELDSPYWRLDDEPDRPLLTRLRSVVRPIGGIVRRAAPRPAAAVLVLQVASGSAVAFGLLATTAVLEGLLTAGPTASRLAAALPGLALVVAAFAVRGLLDAGVAMAQARLVPAVRRAAEEQLLDASLRADLAAFDDPGFYDRLHRANDRGLYHLERAADDLVELIGAAIAVLAAAGSLAVLHPALVPVLALAVVPQGWAVLRSARLEYGGMARTITLRRRVAMIADLLTGREAAPEIRACQAEPFVLGEYRQVADALRDHEIGVGLGQARTNLLGRALAGLGLGATFAALGLLLNAGWMPLAAAGAAVFAIRAATGALTRLVIASNQILEHGLYIADYQDFLADARQRERPSGGTSAPASPRYIALHDVTFQYPDGPLALRDVNLTMYAGQTIALVGENGSGKTTLAKLIAGLYQPTSGRILWDGTDVAEFDPASVTDRVVMVLQNPVKWPHSAEANVRIGRHDRDDPGAAALLEAAARARADEVVAALPNHWRTLLSRYFRDGQDLSGGQWQRLAVARGLYRDGPVLIWDEPTAPLDARAEYAVYESLRRVSAGRTVVLITHRLASVRHADQIFLLHKGVLAEQGTHEELLAADGRYAELYALQTALHAPA